MLFLQPQLLCQNRAMSDLQMTEQKFVGYFQNISVEVEDAIAVFQTYEEINKLAAENGVVLKAFNENPLFWKVQAHSLLTTLFVALSRILDMNPNTLSIHQLLNETLAHPEFFSKDALRKRKSELKIGPEYLDALIDRAWAPADASQLRYLKKALAPHVRKFQEIYLPIRHVYYAHRVLGQPVDQLFALTNRAELGKILSFLRELVEGITYLFLNGTKPEPVGRDLIDCNDDIRASVRAVIGKVVGLATEQEVTIS